MAYSPQVWQNGPSAGTPLNATRLNRLEGGVRDAALVADNANAAVALRALSSDVSDSIATLRTQMFGGPTRTKPFAGRCIYTGNRATLLGGADTAAYGGWQVDATVDSGDNMVGVTTDTSTWYVQAPAAGLYLLTHSSRLVSSAANQYLNGCILKNSTASATRASALVSVSEWNTAAASQRCTPSNSKLLRLAAGDRTFITHGSTAGNFDVIGNEAPNACTFWSLLWVGP